MVTVFENKNSSFNNEVEAEIKIKIKEINLIIQFYNKAKIFLLFDVKSIYISCTPRKQCNNRKKHVSQISHEITSMCWCKIRQHYAHMKYICATFYRILISPFCSKRAQEIMFLWRLNPINCKWSMLPYESQLLTLFLHCVSFSFVWAFYYLKQIGKQNRREQIATFDCVSVLTLTQSNVAICSLRFSSSYKKWSPL